MQCSGPLTFFDAGEPLAGGAVGLAFQGHGRVERLDGERVLGHHHPPRLSRSSGPHGVRVTFAPMFAPV